MDRFGELRTSTNERQIFDVIAEKGELWLAKNQDDPRNQVGWIWSKHFAKLADS